MSADRIHSGSLDPAIAKMQELARLAAGNKVQEGGGTTSNEDFQNLLQNAIRAVNEAQNEAQVKAQSFSTGDSNMSLEEVMVSMQQANVAFQGMIAVRNRLVEAYREVINLQV
ncbi:MAG: hypothetical protein RIR70_1577 [Pseudomonadota bacterium]|jgi:flagellar hook-basal body complex protein FliE